MKKDEINFVKSAVRIEGDKFLRHLKDKGYTDQAFLHHWSAVVEIMNQHEFGPRVLDLGCGPGWTSIFLAGRGCDVTGVDIAPDMIGIARENAKRLGMAINFQVGDIEKPLIFDQPFDGILIFDALHHCKDEYAILRNCFQALRPGGKILLVEPDWFHKYSPHAIEARKNYGTTERGIGFYRLQRILRDCGFSDINRFYNVYATCNRNLWNRFKTFTIVTLTLTIGYPQRPLIVLARCARGIPGPDKSLREKMCPKNSKGL